MSSGLYDPTSQVSSYPRRMIVFPAPFSQVNGHLLPFQADELNPAPVDQGLPTVTDDDIVISVGAQLTAAQGAGLRALRNLLFEKDPSRRFGDLRRVQDP